MPRGGKRFSIFDMMEEKGIFEANSANTFARDSEGASIYKKQDYPRMLYHPKGEERVIVPAQAEVTPFGPKMLGEQREIIFRQVNDPDEEKALLLDGWHKHPADAIVARNANLDEHNEKRRQRGLEPLFPMEVPKLSAENKVSTLEEEKADLLAEIERLKALVPANTTDPAIAKSSETAKAALKADRKGLV